MKKIAIVFFLSLFIVGCNRMTNNGAVFEGKWQSELGSKYSFDSGKYTIEQNLAGASALDAHEEGAYSPAKPEGDYITLQMTPVKPENKKPYFLRFTVSEDRRELRMVDDPAV